MTICKCFSQRQSYIREDYICSPTSSVIAAVIVLLVLLFATAVAFAFFYRSKKRLWKKESECDFHAQSNHILTYLNLFAPKEHFSAKRSFSEHPTAPPYLSYYLAYIFTSKDLIIKINFNFLCHKIFSYFHPKSQLNSSHLATFTPKSHLSPLHMGRSFHRK
ncbi:hypothetical protein Avbf_17523 [Armadillidium vulgare]|nr:hypothetical protein Avbf_17523 [Armadillidium vulgare]